MRDTVLEVLKAHFGNFDHKTFEDDVHLMDDLGGDEFDKVEISIALDQKLNISLDEEKILEVGTVGDLIKLVEAHVQST
ncbi:acyl carrier protein [bacterium]|jgi:acyl carrier protein|nr:acyl carrier protein [bacterium]|tara:strand:- start:916 stop:1152 length:237 start_codon:yes stop_codon:yes gene_type:complete